MPGIVGFFSTDNQTSMAPPHDARLNAMLGTMLHDPRYSSGRMTFEPLAAAVGWVCHRGSYSDCLPIWNEGRDVCLIFVGENFAEAAELNDLAARGHEFDRHSAASLVHLYEEGETEFYGKLNGTFSGVLVDLRRNEIVLFNDRYGLARVYYHQSPEGFYFASEAKALLKALPHLRAIDTTSMGEYLACGAVLQNRTLFKGIALLPPSSAWKSSSRAKPEKRCYFDYRKWEAMPKLPEEEYFSQLRERFPRVLPRYVRGGDAIAMSLTGGLDSRMIMAWLNGQTSRLVCYSHYGMFNRCQDANLGRRVADQCGYSHRLVQVGREFLSEFPDLARQSVYLTDGAMDVTGAAGLYANRAARRFGEVRLTGNYGGEILRHGVMLRSNKLKHHYFTAELKQAINKGLETLAAERRARATTFIAFRQVPWHHYSRYALENSEWTVRSPYLDAELVSLAYQAPVDTRTNQRLAERLIAAGNPELTAFATDRGPLGRHGPLGRFSEAYQEFTFKADYAFDYGMPHWLAKLDRALDPIQIERLFLGRHKYYHFRTWYRHQLSPFVRSLLLDSRTLARPYLNRRRVVEVVEAHTSGKGNYTLDLTALMTTELIQRSLLEESN